MKTPEPVISVTLCLSTVRAILSNPELVASIEASYPRDLKKLRKHLAVASTNPELVPAYQPKSDGVLTLEQKVQRGLASIEEQAEYWESKL